MLYDIQSFELSKLRPVLSELRMRSRLSAISTIPTVSTSQSESS